MSNFNLAMFLEIVELKAYYQHNFDEIKRVKEEFKDNPYTSYTLVLRIGVILKEIEERLLIIKNRH